MDNYDTVETNQDIIDLAKIIFSVYNLQYYNKQYVVAAAETYKQVYLLYKSTYQSNTDQLESFKSHIKVSKDHSWDVGYHIGLLAAELM